MKWMVVSLLAACCSVPWVHTTETSPHVDSPQTIDDLLMKVDEERRQRKGLHSRSSMEEEEDVFDGLDMRLTPSQYRRLYSGKRDHGRSHGRTVATPWAGGVIPYTIRTSDFEPFQLEWIKRAMGTWESLTCVQFRPMTSRDRNYITIRTGEGCWANLGMKGGAQTVNLQNDCFWKGTIEHEFGHTLGMIHEHQRPNRDAYIKVDYYTVKTSFIDQITKYARGSEDKLGLAYDYSSVMHYGKTAFHDMSQRQTVYPRDPTQTDVIGNVMGPSYLDAKLINLMYKCQDRCRQPPRCSADCFVTKDCRCICPNDMPREICQDTGADCERRARDGYCSSDGMTMHTVCRKSCNLCSENGDIPQLPCENSNEQCDAWARDNECFKNPNFMLISCRLACGVCDADEDYVALGACRDIDSSCQIKAEEGKCDMDPGYMLKNCRWSCDFCPEDVGRDPSDKPGCTDFDTVCQYQKHKGLCRQFYPRVTETCPEACNTCDHKITVPSNCIDDDDRCIDWAKAGECEANPGYMSTNCARSCGTCPGMVVPDVVPGLTCRDDDPMCKQWANLGFCNDETINEKCQLSCQQCQEDEGGCVDKNPACSSWASYGECIKNPGYMLNDCQKSCHFC